MLPRKAQRRTVPASTLAPGSADAAAPGAISTRSGRMNSIPGPDASSLLSGARNASPEGRRSRTIAPASPDDRALDQVRLAEEAADERIGRALVHLAGRPI